MVAFRNGRGSSERPLASRGWCQRGVFSLFFPPCVYPRGGTSFCGTREFAVNLNCLVSGSCVIIAWIFRFLIQVLYSSVVLTGGVWAMFMQTLARLLTVQWRARKHLFDVFRSDVRIFDLVCFQMQMQLNTQIYFINTRHKRKQALPIRNRLYDNQVGIWL